MIPLGAGLLLSSAHVRHPSRRFIALETGLRPPGGPVACDWFAPLWPARQPPRRDTAQADADGGTPEEIEVAGSGTSSGTCTKQ